MRIALAEYCDAEALKLDEKCEAIRNRRWHIELELSKYQREKSKSKMRSVMNALIT